MILYFAGAEPDRYKHLLKQAGVKNILLSFFYHNDNKGDKMATALEMFDNVFLDSGGFTARNKGAEIKISDYKDYLLKVKNKEKFHYANLDLKTYEETIDNQRYLEKHGLKPIPVYHFSEYNSKNREVLLDYIKKYDYIAVGGVVGAKLNSIQKVNYLNYVFKHTRDKIKIHGFGITDIKLLKQYPFYSVDSTSWQQRMRFGMSKVQPNHRIRIAENKTFHYLDNVKKEIKYWLDLEKNITALWAKKGIIWK